MPQLVTVYGGGFQDAEGIPLASGSLSIRLLQDVAQGSNQIAAGRWTTLALDANGNRTGRMKSIHFSEAGKELMRQAIDRNDRKPGPRAHDTGFHSECYNFDRSNREESRRADGRRNRD